MAMTNFANISPESNTKDGIRALLLNNEANITFIKKDGTERVMHCTLKSDAITPYEKVTDRVKVQKDDVLSVWDLDNDGWRSINVSTIQVVEIIA